MKSKRNNPNGKASIVIGNAFFVGIVLFLIGCVNGASKPLISVELMNRMGGVCKNVEIELKGKPYELVANVPNGNTSITDDSWPNPMPTNAVLQWTTDNQSNYTAKLLLEKPSVDHPEFLDYYIVMLPNGRANALVNAWSGEPTDAKVNQDIVLEDKLCCDGGPNYRVAVKNLTGGVIDNLNIQFGSNTVNAGTHVDGTGQNYSIATGLPYPATKSTSLHWKTNDGNSWDKIVDLTTNLPSDLNDKCFWFIIGKQENVEVKVVDWKDLRAGKYPDLCHGF